MKNILKILIVLAAMVLALPLLAADNNTPAKTSSDKTASNKQIWNLQNADLNSVIKEIARQTGRNFIIDNNVKGKISIISSKPIDSRQAYQLFLSALQVSGYAAVTEDGVTKIIPDSNAKTYGIPITQGEGDELIAQVIPVNYVSAEQLVPSLRPLLPQSANISAYNHANSLIIAGRASQVKHIAEIVAKVDTEKTNGIEVFPLHNATAAQVVSTLNNLQSAERSRGRPPIISLSADDRSNSVLISGEQKARLRAKILLSQLDAENADGADGNTQVIYLHYLKAENLVPVIANIAQSAYGVTVTTAISNMDQQEDFTDTGDDGFSSGQGSSKPKTNKPFGALREGGAHSVGSTSSSAMGNNSNANGGGKNNNVTIAAEVNTNAIIVTAPKSLMHTLKMVIARLDSRPAQVLVEAVIAEVSQSDLRNLGIEWGTRSTDSSVANSALSPNFGLTGGLGVGFIRKGSLKALVSALGQDTSSNILSTPSVVVLDNKTAKINVGQIVPFQSVSINPNDSGALTQTDRKEVGLHLFVTPQINQGDAVQLKIDQANEVLGKPLTDGSDPVTSGSKIQTTVLVEDGEILVLGGLTSNKIIDTVRKVPILGSLPVLGRAFQSNYKTIDKQNLMIFLRPLIITDSSQANMATNSRYNLIRERQWMQAAGMNTRLSKPHSLLPPWGKASKDAGLPVPFSNRI